MAAPTPPKIPAVRILVATGDSEPVEVATVEGAWSVRTNGDGTLVFSTRHFRRSMRRMLRAMARAI